MLTRWNDFGLWPSLGFRSPRLSRDLDQLFYAFERPQEFTPRVSFEEREDAWVMKSELPGFSEKEIALTVTGSTVTLRAERKTEAKEGKESDKAHAAASYRYERSFELPVKVDPEKVEAELKLGVLTVTLPKAAETRPKQIAVKAA